MGLISDFLSGENKRREEAARKAVGIDEDYDEDIEYEVDDELIKTNNYNPEKSEGLIKNRKRNIETINIMRDNDIKINGGKE